MDFPMPMSSPVRTKTEKELRRQVPPLQTTSTDPKPTPPPSASTFVTPETMADEARMTSSATDTKHKLFVMTDIVAARYIEEDPTTTCTVLARRQKIEGYEIYLVEQWACSRTHPTFLITTYTGNPEDVVLATILSVPADESQWSPQMRLYFKSLDEFHARRKETSYGTLMITNLSGFPSSLTVIPVPGGDVKKYREPFVVNENLKRMGCSGRLGIQLAPPSSATQAKFHQLYRTSEKIPFNASVLELVKLCQVALVLFGKLEPEYADGLLCDLTEKAINDWWVEFGAEYYTVEPHDGILGPTTVAALLGMLMGARNRLSACNAAVSKDVFDLESMKRGIAHFQKSQHLPRTRRLDRHTLDKLRRASAKAASKEGWAVPRAFKSTVAELGGKGGEMVMGIVGAGQKDGIAEVETVDIDQFVELVRGDHAKWLWHGKPRKSTSGDIFDRPLEAERSPSPDKPDHIIKSLRRENNSDQPKLTKRDTAHEEPKRAELITPEGIEKNDSKDSSSKRATIKAKSGSGFSHLKNAVSLRTHVNRVSREEHGRHGLHKTKTENKSAPYTGSNDTQTSVDHYENTVQCPDDALHILSPQSSTDPTFSKLLTETPSNSASALAIHQKPDGRQDSATLRNSVAESDASDRAPTVDSSIAGSVYHGIDLNETLPVDQVHEIPPLLRRTMSDDHLDYHGSIRNDDWWPRHLSFSVAEESILKWNPIIVPDPDGTSLDPTNSDTALTAKYAAQALHSEYLKQLHHRLATLSTTDASWVLSRLQQITDLEASADADIETLDSIYYPHLDTYHALREDTHAIIANNRAQLTASLSELGNIGDKLEYEIGALRSKVEDVEDVLGEFERQG
ncbi:hypothetical protein IAQ61_000929 [Plenodomus lingam]|uniref:uncharacterized protein n=1 Tax=Leptosphaeria maculans TaxID=5022 RepID=UPI0033167967|nr:hypothetical protein IAQ61_000929 [Plenodomus lingam]